VRESESESEAKPTMSDSEEHHFESKADAGASKTYPQQAGTIRKNGYIVIKNRPCKVCLLRRKTQFSREILGLEIRFNRLPCPCAFKQNFVIS